MCQLHGYHCVVTCQWSVKTLLLHEGNGFFFVPNVFVKNTLISCGCSHAGSVFFYLGTLNRGDLSPYARNQIEWKIITFTVPNTIHARIKYKICIVSRHSYRNITGIECQNMVSVLSNQLSADPLFKAYFAYFHYFETCFAILQCQMSIDGELR